MTQAGEKRGPVRLMSWNIHGAVGLDGHYHPERVTEMIQRYDPDILSLQEIDSRGRAPGHRPMDRFEGLIGDNVAHGYTVQSPDGEYGHVLISRWPLKDNRLHDISVRWREPRAAIESTVATPYGDIHVISVHFGLDIWERRRQANQLRAIAAAASAPVGVALGDFNDWAWPGPVQRALTRVFPVFTAHRTFPARMPVFKLDRLYCRPAEALLGGFVDRSGSIASDHLPLIVDLDPRAGAGPG